MCWFGIIVWVYLPPQDNKLKDEILPKLNDYKYFFGRYFYKFLITEQEISSFLQLLQRLRILHHRKDLS